MEDIYKFELDADMFEKLLSGKKTAQLAINEPKRKVYAVRNQITFVKKADETQVAEGEAETLKEVKAEIENLLYFADIKEAVDTLGVDACGYKHSATSEKATDLFLSGASYETIEKYGIVAIVFKVME